MHCLQGHRQMLMMSYLHALYTTGGVVADEGDVHIVIQRHNLIFAI